MYKTILVPTDFSEPAGHAWDHAVALAKVHHAQLVALYVVEPVLSHYGVVGLLPAVKDLEERHDVTARLKLKEVLEKVSESGVAVRSRVIQGKPWQVIIDAAREEKADLIVMGTHSRTGLAHEALGSTAERVVQKAHCPVLVVRTGE